MTHAVIIAIGSKSSDERLQFSLNGTKVRVTETEYGKKILDPHGPSSSFCKQCFKSTQATCFLVYFFKAVK